MADKYDPDEPSGSSLQAFLQLESQRDYPPAKKATRVDDAALNPTLAFRFFDLPTEIRHHIYSFLIPRNITIALRTISPHTNRWRREAQYWPITGVYKDGRHVHIGGNPYCTHRAHKNSNGQWCRHLRGSDLPNSYRYSRFVIQTQLFQVSKYAYHDVQSVLYGQNIFKFTLDGNALQPRSLRSPAIFGLLGKTEASLALLRNLRRVHIHLLATDVHWSVKRQRSRLAYFVEIIKEHADNANKKSLLEELTVTFALTGGRHDDDDDDPLRAVEKSMFALESLVPLRGIRTVQISGSGLPEWYIKCLQLAMQGESGEVEKSEWPLVRRRRRRAYNSRYRILMATSRMWYHPMLNWKVFAERNGVALPDDIDRLWAIEE
ncbi:hypothetical protein GMOD_00007846 [Pyrenophora seminiperda CCB06]|uniref:F-box domain-containing protein n=1 Tax=Pyrenophora seminiperda CCB06 TaxID=1302712 RepID=A0A3M7MFS6_9PLEO|nr:hypothetical protein GMOD_00007846 [Pyrenophora seminiperda CCB06]